jgi:sporulation protein YunB
MYNKTKQKIIILIITLSIVLPLFFYRLDKVITPTVMAVADGEMRAKAIEIINMCILDEYSKEFKYEDIIKAEKDNEGNIIMLKADTLKLNRIGSNVAIKAQREIKNLGSIGVKVPIGYISKNNILANFGPDITVRMQPIGYIEASYSSEFESAGINQTRHKIYLQVKTSLKVIIPFASNNIEVKNEIPIAETIIVGKIPNAAINFDVGKWKYDLKN